MPLRRRLRSPLALGLFAFSLFTPAVSAQFCPSYSTCRTAPVRALNPEISALASLFDRISQGPSRYGTLGWNFSTTLPDGCGIPTATRELPALFPCVLLKAISLTESPAWRQFCVPTAPSPGVTSQTLISSDCGYGLMGISRGMHLGESSDFDPLRVASEPGYNISVGAGLLAEAWRAMPCVGDRRVRVLEDWYFAVWAYGGLTYRNNPSNPLYRADRAPYGDPGGLSASEYPYQEVVFGWIRNPPSTAHYPRVRVSLPRRSEICGTCGGPNANVRDPEEIHTSECPATPTDASTDAPSDASTDVLSDAPSRDLWLPDTLTDLSMPRSDLTVSDTETLDAEGPPAVDLPREGCGCRANNRVPTAPLGLFGLLALRRKARPKRHSKAL